MKRKGQVINIYGTPFRSSVMLAPMSVGSRIKALRIEKGMDQGELARAAKIKQSTLSDLESGRSQRPRGDSLVRLAAVLQVDHDWLMTGHGLPLPKVQPDIDESHLLAMYRAMTDANRSALIATARALMDSQGSGPELPGRPSAKHRTQ